MFFNRNNDEEVDLDQKYDNAIDYLNENYAYFLTNVLNIGEPRWTHEFPTAAVALPLTDDEKQKLKKGIKLGKKDVGDNFEFVFNPSFAASIEEDKDFAFILAHETMHIVLYHLTLAQDFDNNAIFNIAADCVINDYLVNAGFDGIEGLMYGDKVVGFNCCNSTVTEIYNIINHDEDLKNKMGLGDKCPNCGGDKKPQDEQDQDDSKQDDENGSGGQGEENEDGSGGEEENEDGSGGSGDEEQDGEGEGDEQDGEGSGGQGEDQSEGSGGSGGDEEQDGEGSGEGGSGQPQQDHQHSRDGQPCNCPGGPGNYGGFKQIDDHGWMHDLDEDEAKDKANKMKEMGIDPNDLPDDLEEILNETMNEYQKTQMAGKGQSAKEEFMKAEQVTMKWIELLEKVDPDMFHESGRGPRPRTTWRHPRRKITSMYPNVLLPADETPPDPRFDRDKSDVKPMIALALDTSGSIGNETANKFVNLAKSIPQDKVKVEAFTFTGSVMPLDLDKPRWVSGGTAFSPIENYINQHIVPLNDGKYPSAVVIVTDGHATFSGSKPSKENAGNWFWLLLDHSDKRGAMMNFANRTYGFKKENFDVLDGYVNENIDWHL